MSLEEIGAALQKIPMMKDWAKELEAYAYNQLNSGKHIPGYKLVAGKKKNKSWNQEDKVVMNNLESVGLTIPDYLKTDLRTPTQIINILKARKEDPDAIDDLWDQLDGEPTIALESDKRRAIKTQAHTDFSVIN